MKGRESIGSSGEMERETNYRRPVAALTAALVLYLLGHFIPNSYVVSILFMTAVCVTAVVLWLYGPLAWFALWREDYDHRDNLAVGMVLTAGGLLGVEVWGLMGRMFGVPSGLVTSTLTKVLFAGIIIGFMFKLLAYSQRRGTVPFWRAMRPVIVAAVLGIALGVGLVLLGEFTGTAIIPPAGAPVGPMPPAPPRDASPDEQ